MKRKYFIMLCLMSLISPTLLLSKCKKGCTMKKGHRGDCMVPKRQGHTGTYGPCECGKCSKCKKERERVKKQKDGEKEFRDKNKEMFCKHGNEKGQPCKKCGGKAK